MANPNANKVFVTQEGYNELLKEHHDLIHVVREEVREELQAARSQGDLSENADYDAARDRQARVEARITELENMLQNIEIIDDQVTKKGGAKTVKLGTTITILDISTNEEETYTVVGSVEADPFHGKISNVCALAQAMLEKKEGETVRVNAEETYDVKIVKIH